MVTEDNLALKKAASVFKLKSHQSLLWLFLLGTSVIIIGIFSIIVQSLAVWIAFLFFGLLGILLTLKAGKTALYLFGAVYCANVIIAIMIYSFYLSNYGTPYYYGGSDDLAFEQYAQQAAQHLKIWEYTSIRGGIVDQYHNSPGYIYIISLLFRMGEGLGGFHTMLPRILNAAALGLISVIIFVIAIQNGIQYRIARNAALLVGLLPIMTFNAAHSFRDILVSLLSIWVIYQWDKTIKSASQRIVIVPWIWTFLIVVIMWEIRQTQVLALIVISIICDLFLVNRRRIFGDPRFYFRLVILCILVIAGAWQIGIEWATPRTYFYIDYYREYHLGISPGLSNYIFSAPLLISFPLRAVYGLISPLPFVGQRFEELFQGIGTILHFFFLPFLGLGIARWTRSRRVRLWILSFALLFVMSLITFTSRHFVVFIPYAALITAEGYTARRKDRKIIWFFVAFLGIILIIIYALLKMVHY